MTEGKRGAAGKPEYEMENRSRGRTRVFGLSPSRSGERQHSATGA